MARKVIQSPLEGAAPGLTPTARPMAIPIGATPAPNRSPLMELAQSFDGFNGELRNMLRDAAAREEQDALALGELEAQRTNASARMGEIETVLKQAVDEGKVSHVRLPAFDRGFRLRAGKDLAQSVFQEALLKRLPDTLKVEGRADPEEVIRETYASVSEQIHPSDLYARAAFDQTAQGVMAGFRQRSAEGYTAEYRRVAEQKIADEGSEILFQLAASPEDEVADRRLAVKGHLDYIRNELPKSEVNSFYVKNVVGPAVDKLVSQEKFTEARQLLDEMDRLDVTGSGGMLGQTSVAKAVFTDMRSRIEMASRTADDASYKRLLREREALQVTAETDAARALNDLRLGNDGKLNPNDRFRLVDEYRKANASDPLKVQSFSLAVQREYENEDKWRSNEREIAELEVSLKSLKKEDLDAGRARLSQLWQSGQIPGTAYVRISENISKLGALYGAIDEGDFKQVRLDLYAYKDSLGGRSVNFGDIDGKGANPSQTLWERLDSARQTDHEQRVVQFFNEQLQAEIRGIGDPAKVPAEKAQAISRATLKTREYARTLLGELSTQQRGEEVQKQVRTQAVAQKIAATQNAIQSRLARMDDKPPASIARVERIPGATPTQGETTDWAKVWSEERAKPRAERDIVSVPLKSRGWIQVFGFEDTRLVSLKALAASAKVEGGGQPVADAKNTYAYAKGLLGFTPEEVKAGETIHGVRFNPAEIDAKRHTVFRNKAELEKHWNKGEPDDLFMELGNLLDPNDKMTSAEFYLAQLALLREIK